MERISEHISYAEATKSQVAVRNGLKNDPDEGQLANMKETANNIFEPCRNHYDCPIFVSSFFRSEEVNKKAKGSKTSDHVTGRAIDMDADVYGKISNRDLFNFIKENLDFDQLIWEFGDDNNPDWVHGSFRKGANRKQVKRARVVGGKTVYETFS